MIGRLRALFTFWYDFLVGDDWRVAATVVVSLIVTVAANRLTGAAPWWLIVATVAVTLPASIYRVTRASPHRPSSSST
jgi:hypothetical protein